MECQLYFCKKYTQFLLTKRGLYGKINKSTEKTEFLCPFFTEPRSRRTTICITVMINMWRMWVPIPTEAALVFMCMTWMWRMGILSLVGKEIIEFSAQAYHNGEFITVTDEEIGRASCRERV